MRILNLLGARAATPPSWLPLLPEQQRRRPLADIPQRRLRVPARPQLFAIRMPAPRAEFPLLVFGSSSSRRHPARMVVRLAVSASVPPWRRRLCRTHRHPALYFSSANKCKECPGERKAFESESLSDLRRE